jgi:Kef-type K+ transport system membrane component KefB
VAPPVRQRLYAAAQYLLLVGVPGLALLAILHAGSSLHAPAAAESIASASASSSVAPMPNLLLLLVQVALIVACARLLSRLFRAIHQPQVVGEMVAGLMLGPSLLGWVAPELSHTLFSPASLGFLNSISQLGLLVFMFLVGLELDPKLLHGRGQTVVVTSHVSIIIPFMLGALLSYGLYPRLSSSDVSFMGFALFMGAAMSMTAFPVLARILTEKGLLRTRVGAVALACAAVDDVTAWSILAAVVLLVRASAASMPLWATLGGSALFVLAMIFAVRPLLRRFAERFRSDGRLTHDRLAGVLVLALVSALMTEWLGIHALFGAFLAGAVMPKETAFVRALASKLSDMTVVLLLPLFFAFTGLRTSIGLISGDLWTVCGTVIAAAVAGKWGGSMVAARMTGMGWREATAVGVLMNTRGLMELVILNVGLDIGVISPTLFAIMVLMALVTTFMTTPLVGWIYPAWRKMGSDSI